MSCCVYVEVLLTSDSDDTYPKSIRLSRDDNDGVILKILDDDRRLTMSYWDLKQAVLALEKQAW